MHLSLLQTNPPLRLQCPDKHQRYVASVLGLPQHKVVVRTKRLGGGFGGKETRSAFINAAAAVPAHLLRRPVRLVLDRDEDMAMTGQRHPFMARYKVGGWQGKDGCTALTLPVTTISVGLPAGAGIDSQGAGQSGDGGGKLPVLCPAAEVSSASAFFPAARCEWDPLRSPPSPSPPRPPPGRV